jgi:hypothetical protein
MTGASKPTAAPAPALREGEVPEAAELRKCGACPRLTRGCVICKQVREAPYDHLCAKCHTTALGEQKHDWVSA